MKLSVSMDFIKPLSGALKKYKALMPSVIILIVAIFLFFPLLWLGGKVKSQVQVSVGNANKIRTLMSTPPREQVQQVKSFMDKLEQEAESVHRMAVQSTLRDLVTYDYVLFPEPQDPSSQVYSEFGQRYRQKVESLITKMKAKDAPSQTEIRAKTGVRRGAGGMGATLISAQDPMVDALCQKRAQEISVYINPDAFSWYKFWSDYEFTGRDQALQDCWDSQVALWIYEDVVDTILKMNGTSEQVSAAPVKRLLGVRFDGPVIIENTERRPNAGLMIMGAGVMTQGQGRDLPNYITSTLPSNYVPSSPTGRVSNENVDIVHFALSVILDNRSVLTFMKELCSEKPHRFYPEYDPRKQKVESRHNQISILEHSISVVDAYHPDHEYYRYGKSAAMRLDLVCEYLFVREGYDMIKPDLIKERLGQLSEEATSDIPTAIGM